MLNDTEVAARTDAVIKMANVTGDAAEEVSSYMTAIWNNFAKGSTNLEHFGDVITALGATTAASSSEIAEGLEKFASIGDTIGLSYDYATSILAAMVANTRQSADVIGTSLRTIFARLQGLSLGETLDDGVTLNKYSTALQKIGVQILDQNNNLKDANTILDETAARWDTLSGAQQNALAQTIAGNRQYAQFIAMMENWGDVQKNLTTAANADGTLQEQADIYKESWEAASKEVKTALQGLYDSLINEKAFIKLTKAFADLIGLVEKFVDTIGGMGGTISLISGIFLNAFATKAPDALNNLKQNIMVLAGQSKRLMTEVQQDLQKQLDSIANDSTKSESFKAQAEGYARVSAMQEKLAIISNTLTESEKQEYKLRMAQVEAIYAEIAALKDREKVLAAQLKIDQSNEKREVKKSAVNLINDYQKKEDEKTKAEAQKSVITEKKEKETFSSTYGPLTEDQFKKQQEYDNKIQEQDVIIAKAEEAQQKIIEDIKKIEDAAGETGTLIVKSTGKIAEDASDKIEASVNAALDNINAEQQASQNEYERLLAIADDPNISAEGLLDTIKSRHGGQYWKQGNKRNLIGDDVFSYLKNFISANDLDKYYTANKDYKSNNILSKNQIDELKAKTADLGLEGEEFEKAIQEWVEKLKKNILDAAIDQARQRMLDADGKKIDLGVSVSTANKTNETREDQVANNVRQTAAYANADNVENPPPTEPSDKNTQKIQVNYNKLAQAASQYASTLATLNSAYNAVKNALETFGDEEATTAEKITAAITAISTAMFALNSITALNRTLTESQIPLKLAEVLGWELDTRAVEKNTLARMKNLLILNPWIVAVGLAVAVIGAIVIATRKHTTELEKATKAAEEAAEAYEKVQSSIDEVTNSLKTLSEQRSTLDNLTEGSLEWLTAIQKINETITELIEKYPELANYVSWDENGAMFINDDGLKLIEEENKRQLSTAYTNTLNANYNKQKAEIADKINNHHTEKTSGETVWDPNSGLEGVTGKVAPNEYFGEAINNALISNIAYALKDVGGLDGIQNSTDDWDAYIKKIFKNNENILGKMDDANKQILKDLITENHDFINQLSLDYANLEIARKNIFTQTAVKNGWNANLADDLGKNFDYQSEFNSSKNNLITAFGSGSAEYWTTDENGIETLTDEGKKIAEEYAKSKGGKLGSIDGNIRSFSVVDDNGNNIERVGGGTEDFANFVASNEMQDKMSSALVEGAKDYAADYFGQRIETDTITQASEEGGEETREIIKPYYGEFEDYSEEELQELLNFIDQAETVIGDGSKEFINEFFNNDELFSSDDKFKDKIDEFQEDYANINLNNSDDVAKLVELQNQLEANVITEGQYEESLLKLDQANKLVALSTGLLKEQATDLGFSEDEAQEIAEYAKYLMEVGDDVDELSDSLDTNADAAAATALEIARMNRGLKTLESSGEDWIDTLNSENKASEDYFKALNNLRSAMGDLLNINGDLLSADFMTSHSGDIQAAINGDLEAIDRLQAAVGQEILLKPNIIGDPEDIQNQVNSILAGLEPEDLEIGATIDDTGIINALNEIIQGANMTADQANAYLSSIGYEPMVYEQEENITDTQENPEYDFEVQENGMTSLDGVFNNETLSGLVQIPNVSWKQTKKDSTKSTTNQTKTLVGISGDGTAPEIDVIKKKASGSSASSSGKKSSGGGGGGGSSKKTQAAVTDRADPYRDINRTISRVSDKLSTLGKEQSHVFGAELINNLKAQNELLETQYKNYERMDEIIESEGKRLQEEMSPYGFIFDEKTGEITNYVTAYEAAIDEYQAAIDEFNASAQSDADQEKLDAAKERYDEIVSLMSEYDENRDKEMENEQEKLENYYQQIENKFKAWEEGIQVALDLSNAKQEWTKFWQKVNSDIRTTSKNYAKELGDITKNFNLATKDVTIEIGAVEDIKEEIEKFQSDPEYKSEMFASESEAAKTLMEHEENLMNEAEEVYDLYTEAWESYLESVDDVVDKWADLIDEFNEINDSIEHTAKVIELLYGDTQLAKQMTDQLYDTANFNNLMTMDALRQEIDALNTERAELLAQGADELDEDIVKITDAIDEAQVNMESAIETYLQGLADQFANSVSLAMAEMEKQLTNGSTYSQLSTRWEDAQHAAEGYYDDLERIYQLETLENKWQDTINSTNLLKSQQKLNELMKEQLADLESKTELSEYDIELAEKQLAVAQAQIALEEAQNNKNTMKLVRNEQGNWAYQYVADEDNVADKQQALLDSYQEWYEFTKTSWEDLTAEIISDMETAQDRLTELMEEYNTADEARRAEIQAEYDYLYDYYYGENGLIVTKCRQSTEIQADLNAAMMNDLDALYLVNEENYERMTDAEKALLDSLTKENISQYELFKDAVAGNEGIYDQMLDKCEEVNQESINLWTQTATEVVNRWAYDSDSVQNIVSDAYDAVIEAQEKYDQAVAEGTAASGVNYTNLSTEISSLRDRINEATTETTNLVTETDKLSSYQSVVNQLATAWANVAKQVSAAAAAMSDYNSLVDAESDYDNSTPDINSGTPRSKKASSTSGDSSGSGSGSGSNLSSLKSLREQAGTGTTTKSGQVFILPTGEDTKETFITVANKSNYKFKSLSDFINLNDDPGSSKESIALADGYKYILLDKNGNIKGYTKTNQWSIASMDTGGYTGSWNDTSGRMAILHSKELVLNADDTENMLQAVEAVRSISNIGSSITASIANGVSNMVKSLLGFTQPANINTTGGVVSAGDTNEFNITAEFPNANSVEDIREAIFSLPTLASQYLSQKKL